MPILHRLISNFPVPIVIAVIVPLIVIYFMFLYSPGAQRGVRPDAVHQPRRRSQP